MDGWSDGRCGLKSASSVVPMMPVSMWMTVIMELDKIYRKLNGRARSVSLILGLDWGLMPLVPNGRMVVGSLQVGSHCCAGGELVWECGITIYLHMSSSME